MLTQFKRRAVMLALVTIAALVAGDAWAQPGYYTFDVYGGRFTGATRPGIAAPAYAGPANVAYAQPQFGFAQTAAYANPCNPCAVNPCAVQHSVGYAPVTTYAAQTRYRLGFTRTAYRPVTSVDPCGNTSVQYQAYRTLLPRLARVPVTTHQPVTTLMPVQGFAAPVHAAYQAPQPYYQPQATAPGCSACPTVGGTVQGAPLAAGGLPTPSLRPIHGQEGTTVYRQEPWPSDWQVQQYQAPPEQQQLQQQQQQQQHQQQQQQTNGQQFRQFQAAPNDDPQHDSRLKALPPAEVPDSFGNRGLQETGVPQLLNPNDKSAQAGTPGETVPVVYASQLQPVRHLPQGSTPLDDSGWRSER